MKNHANDMQNRAQMKESKCAKDILKSAPAISVLIMKELIGLHIFSLNMVENI